MTLRYDGSHPSYTDTRTEFYCHTLGEPLLCLSDEWRTLTDTWASARGFQFHPGSTTYLPVAGLPRDRGG
jgi:hypothetical protein